MRSTTATAPGFTNSDAGTSTTRAKRRIWCSKCSSRRTKGRPSSAAKVAALLAIGFGVAWFASGRGWLPGTPGPDIAGVLDGGAEAVAPDRAWLASNDYSDRLEVLLLGVARREPVGGEDVGVVREVSRELLSDSRFYRRVADRNDDPALSNLLSRVEIILLALATAPEGEEQEVMDSLREFIDESDLLSELREVRTSAPRLRRPRLVTTSGS